MINEDETDKNLADYYFDIALSLNPNYEQALLNKTRIYVLNNEIKQARKLLQKISSIYPDNEAIVLLLKQINEKE